MQVSDDRSRLLVAAGITFIVIGVVLNLIVLGRGGDGYFIVFPFVFGFGNSTILVGLLVLTVFLVFFGFFVRWGLTVPETIIGRTSVDSLLRLCRSCQRPVQADASYCPYCGSLLDADQ